MERSDDNQFKTSLVEILICGVVVIVAYIIRRYYGLSLNALVLIGVIACNVAVALFRRGQARRAKVSSAS